MSPSAALVLYPFAHFDLLRRRWVRARYLAEFSEIARRYEVFKITGVPERRERGDASRVTGHER